MGKDHRGQPSGTNKSEEPTGLPNKLSPDDQALHDEMTERYTRDDQEVADHVREMNPNRNTDKTDATNAGGYKN